MTDANTLKRNTAWLSIMSNTLLVILKLAVGLYVGAVSLVSEALHSGVDLIAAFIAFWAVRKAVVPPDKEHDYGHGKFENLSSAVEALLIVATAIFIIYEAIHKFNTPLDPEFLQYGIYIMFISIVVNIIVSRRLIAVAKKTDSQALEADGLHLQADVWTSVGVLLGLVGMKVFGFLWLDPVIAIIVALIIFRAGYKMVVDSVKNFAVPIRHLRRVSDRSGFILRASQSCLQSCNKYQCAGGVLRSRHTHIHKQRFSPPFHAKECVSVLR